MNSSATKRSRVTVFHQVSASGLVVKTRTESSKHTRVTMSYDDEEFEVEEEKQVEVDPRDYYINMNELASALFDFFQSTPNESGECSGESRDTCAGYAKTYGATKEQFDSLNEQLRTYWHKDLSHLVPQSAGGTAATTVAASFRHELEPPS